jgi:hypothetical protein
MTEEELAEWYDAPLVAEPFGPDDEEEEATAAGDASVRKTA